MSAASPGVIALFHSNQHYDDYIAALADAMKTEYDAIHAADAPRPPWMAVFP
jgi:5-methyltetrahydropteroyltriglutamate--homocysteine methyltransferase